MRVETFGSLFSGILGLDLGLEAAGMTPLWCAEIEPFCCELIAARRPGLPNLGDVRAIPAQSPEKPHVLAGGFPCQPVSDAGKRRATSDDRWLWPAMRDVVAYAEPEVVLIENVPGLLRPWSEPEPTALATLEATAEYQAAGERSGARSRMRAKLPKQWNPAPMGEVVGDLADLGYAAEWDVIPAAAVGAPHLRFRVFIVAWRDGEVRNLFGPAARSTLDETWPDEPPIPRLLRDVDRRRERLTALGNGVVPKVAEWIGGRIRELADEPDDLLWGWPVAQRVRATRGSSGDWTRRGVKGVAAGQRYMETWPKAGYLVGGVAHGDSPTIDKGMRARWKTPTSAPWSYGGCGGPLQMDVVAAEADREMLPTPAASEPGRIDFEMYVVADGSSIFREDGTVAWGERWYHRETKQIIQRGLATLAALERLGYRPLLPTPQASDGQGGRDESKAAENGWKRPSGAKAAKTLRTAVEVELGERPMLPTPVAEDASGRLRQTRGDGSANESDAAARSGAHTLTDAARILEGEAEGGIVVERFPTPVASDAFGSRRRTARTSEWTSNDGTTLLDHVLLSQPEDRAVLPTPTARDHKGSSEALRDGGPDLPTAVARFPTPKATPSGPDYARAGREESGGDDLATAIARQEGESAGGLNPEWVEWLMGLPPGWTLVPAVD